MEASSPLWGIVCRGHKGWKPDGCGLSLPWYILSYLGMGQVFWNTLPFITPLVTLAAIIYRALQRRLHIPATLAVAASASVLAIFLLPRNYWAVNWSGMLHGVLARQFYPYYFYPVGPFLAMLAAQLATSPNSGEPPHAPHYTRS